MTRLGQPPCLALLGWQRPGQLVTGRCEPDDRGHVLRPCPSRPLLITADEQGRDPQPSANDQRTDAGRPAELVAAERHQVDPRLREPHGHVADRRRRVHVHQRPPVDCGHQLAQRLARAHLVVAPLAVDEPGLGHDGCGSRCHVDPAGPVDGHDALGPSLRPLPNGGVLDP